MARKLYLVKESLAGRGPTVSKATACLKQIHATYINVVSSCDLRYALQASKESTDNSENQKRFGEA